MNKKTQKFKMTLTAYVNMLISRLGGGVSLFFLLPRKKKGKKSKVENKHYSYFIGGL